MGRGHLLILSAVALWAPSGRAEAPAAEPPGVAAAPAAAPEPAPEPAPASPEKAPPRTVAILGFGSNPEAKDQADGVETLVATHVAKAEALKVITSADIATLLTVERQKQLLGCSDSSCVTELAGALGARYVISGRLDRFGERYVLTASVFDSDRAGALAKHVVEAGDEGDLPEASKDLAARAVATLGATLPSGDPAQAKDGPGKVSLGLKVGNAFLANIASFSLSGDLELGYRFDTDWLGFLQIGVTIVRPQSEILPEDFVILPSVLGARHLYRVKEKFQPYWGLGLGVQLAIGDRFGIFQNTGPLPTVIGQVGFQYAITRHLLLGFEGSSNIAQAVLGLTGDGLHNGFNLDLNGTVAWRF